MITAKKKIVVIGRVIGGAGMILLLVGYLLKNQSGHAVFLAGLGLLCLGGVSEVLEEVMTGVAKIAYGTESIEKRRQPFSYWFLIILHTGFIAGGFILIFVLYSFKG